MAVHALGKDERLLEIAVDVALRAIDRGMLSFQRKLCFGVIEALIHVLQRDFLPATGVVTRLTGLRETAVMRVLVAVGALVEWDADVLRLALRSVDVALRALHLRVQAG